jgi:putative endonuclease
MFYLYILKSELENWYYVGMTADIQKRLGQHNKGEVRSTKARRPYRVVYTEEYPTKTEARKRELQVKRNWQIKKEIIRSVEALSSNG